MAFKKGSSGNPSGRPKVLLADGRSLSDIAKQHTEAAVQALVDVLTDGESEAARVSAANSLLDRGWGRPKQDIGVEVSDDLVEIIAERRAQVAAGRGE